MPYFVGVSMTDFVSTKSSVNKSGLEEIVSKKNLNCREEPLIEYNSQIACYGLVATLLLVKRIHDCQASDMREIFSVVRVQFKIVQQGGGRNDAITYGHLFHLTNFSGFINYGICNRYDSSGLEKCVKIRLILSI